LLIDLIVEATEKRCGHKPDKSMVEQFLSNYRSRSITLKPEPDGRPLGVVGKEIPPPSLEGDFAKGISDEVINIRALWQGKQIVLCKAYEKTNNRIFLLPKTTFEGAFTPSEEGRKLMPGFIETNIKYVAEIDEYLPIPGKNRKFWEELYNEGEFNLWVIDKGPLLFFGRSQRNEMLLWILRVYEMPFELEANKDFERGPRGNNRMKEEALGKIQTEFSNSKFEPVLTDDDFKRRKKKITEIAHRYS